MAHVLDQEGLRCFSGCPPLERSFRGTCRTPVTILPADVAPPSQATRKQVFQTILPLLSAGLIRPVDGKRPAKKDERLIREQVRTRRTEQREAGEEADAFVALTNLIEQACNC